MAEDEDIRRARQARELATASNYYVRDPKTGLSPAQVEANAAVAEAAAASGRTVTPGKIGTAATSNRVALSGADRAALTIKEREDRFSAELAAREASKPTEDPGPGNIWSFNVREGRWKKVFTGAGLGGGKTGGGGTGGGGTGGGGSTGGGGGGTKYTASDGTVFTDQNAYIAYENNLRKERLATDAANAAAFAERKSAYDLLYQQFAKYGLQSLVTPLEGLIKEGVPASEFAIRLRETDAYQKRFFANKARLNKGLSVLSEAEYIGLEDQYQNIMRQYGMPESYYTRGELGRQEGFEKFIAGDVSPAELETRISTAYNRVINSNPEVVQALKQFYPNITNGDILSYALDPEKALTDINKKVTAAEIGGAAIGAGLGIGMARAEELGAFGVSKAQAQQGYQTIADILPSATKLSSIYAKQGLGPYDQAVAEQEVFGISGAATAAQKRRKLSELETAQFSGQTGVGALARERAGTF